MLCLRITHPTRREGSWLCTDRHVESLDHERKRWKYWRKSRRERRTATEKNVRSTSVNIELKLPGKLHRNTTLRPDLNKLLSHRARCTWTSSSFFSKRHFSNYLPLRSYSFTLFQFRLFFKHLAPNSRATSLQSSVKTRSWKQNISKYIIILEEVFEQIFKHSLTVSLLMRRFIAYS